MPEEIANPNIEPERYSPFWFRMLEILPGASIWLALLSPFIVSFYFPLQVTLFIIAFDVYWLQKSLYSAYMLYLGYRRMHKNLETNWPELLQKLGETSEEERRAQNILDPNQIYNAIILTTYKEEQAILESSLQSIVDSNFDHQKMFVVLATEGRDSENARKVSSELKERFSHAFFRFIVTEHPDGIVGEVKGKGANATWAAKELTSQVKAAGIPLDHVIVSTADADCRFQKNYFACLAFQYATTSDRTNCGFQPIATFLNNVWETPMMSRVAAFSVTFWHLAESVQDYRLFTFSTHAMSLQTLQDINYWCTSVVNEDSRQYFRAYFRYQGKFRVVPLFMPVYMDAVFVNNSVDTYKNLYLQQQRWAYGVEHFPYIALESVRQKRIPLFDRVILVWRAYHGSFSWGTNAFFISVVGWLPIVLNNVFRDQVLASNFPLVTRVLLSITWIGIITAYIVALKLLPPFPEEGRRMHIATFVFQWALVPISTIVFGAIPGIDAQTRLMLGKYLGFRVTEKRAVGKPSLQSTSSI